MPINYFISILGRADPGINLSRAKFEGTWGVSWSWGSFVCSAVAPQNQRQICEMWNLWSEVFHEDYLIGIEKRKFGDRPKRALAKCCADASHYQGVTKIDYFQALMSKCWNVEALDHCNVRTFKLMSFSLAEDEHVALEEEEAPITVQTLN